MTEQPAYYYIYYRVAAARTDEAVRAVAAMQSALEQEFGIAGRLLHGADEPSLWMEIYDGVRDRQAFESMLARLVDLHGFASLLAPGAGRITERFLAGAPSTGIPS